MTSVTAVIPGDLVNGRKIGCRLLGKKGSVDARSDRILGEDSVQREWITAPMHIYILKNFWSVAATTTTTSTAAAAAAVVVLCKLTSKEK